MEKRDRPLDDRTKREKDVEKTKKYKELEVVASHYRPLDSRTENEKECEKQTLLIVTIN